MAASKTSKSVKSSTNGRKASVTLMHEGEFKGDITVVFGPDPADFYKTFSFGQKKARYLLAAIEAHGVEAVVDMIRKVAESK